jgi:serine/threonine protein kinase
VNNADGPTKNITSAADIGLPTQSLSPRSNPNATAAPAGESRGATEKKSIGNYLLVKKLGEGGMGQVWLAERTAPVRRQVALKLIKVGMYDDTILHRFESERQSLPIMDHPSIAGFRYRHFVVQTGRAKLPLMLRNAFPECPLTPS